MSVKVEAARQELLCSDGGIPESAESSRCRTRQIPESLPLGLPSPGLAGLEGQLTRARAQEREAPVSGRLAGELVLLGQPQGDQALGKRESLLGSALSNELLH